MVSGGYTIQQLLEWACGSAVIDGFKTRENGRVEIWRAGYKHEVTEETARRLLIDLLKSDRSYGRAQKSESHAKS